MQSPPPPLAPPPPGKKLHRYLPFRPFLRTSGQQPCPEKLPSQPYPGAGTSEDPYIVTWTTHDPENPYNWSFARKSFITFCLSLTAFASSMSSSAYGSVAGDIARQFHVSEIVSLLGLSLFVLGFALGPVLWAPLSELHGRRKVFLGTYVALTAFNAGAAGAGNIQTIVVLRFLAGAVGSSSNANAGAQVVDMWGVGQRGLAMSLLVLAPFVGPAVGPILGGFIGDAGGWRWVLGFLGIFAGAVTVVGAVGQPETYAPVLLRVRAERLGRRTGKVYRSLLEVENGVVDARKLLKTALGRPWILLFVELIVLLLSVWIGIIYGTLYMFFSAFPIVYGQGRGYNQGQVGLCFIGIAIGMCAGVAYAIPENFRYLRVMKRAEGKPIEPEQRLIPAMVGAPLVPIALFWFAFTNAPSISPVASAASGVPFGFGMVTIYLSITNYLVDGYTIYAASALAGNALFRTLCGVAFPLFAGPMYAKLGIHWASSIPAFLSLLCVPVPFVLYRFGSQIRKRSIYAAEAERVRLLVHGK